MKTKEKYEERREKDQLGNKENGSVNENKAKRERERTFRGYIAMLTMEINITVILRNFRRVYIRKKNYRRVFIEKKTKEQS